MSTDPKINEARDRYLVLLDEYWPQGANTEQRKTISDVSGHHWPAGMIQGRGDKPGGHLCMWVGGPDGPKTHLTLTEEGRFWAAAKRAAAAVGMTVDSYLAKQSREHTNWEAVIARLAKRDK